MNLKSLIKIWFAIFWRIILYSWTVSFYFVSIASLILLYCLNHGLIDDLRGLVFAVFGLSSSAPIAKFSYGRLIISETLNAVFNFPLLYLALKRLPAIPFKNFSIKYKSLKQPWIILGPINFLCYLALYLGVCTFLRKESEIAQFLLAVLMVFTFIPIAFKNCLSQNDR
ncbi:hypothetical protein [Candidatus Odyssella thessalonicensis]|uniref:hypothetical protein n=1 Tax=Candidatus Odyssella thessalonicensis TaxID=84647 RepID=UPI000225C15D|nr:hypothetical protein [Candidatus Odyssella thessalonicensis]